MILRLLLLAFLGLTALQAQPAREGFVDVPGGPVWYNILGDKNGIPLLAVHGGPGGTSCSFYGLQPLTKQRPIVFYDQLGSGRSGRPSGERLWTLDRFVEELDAVRKKLGLRRIHLLGHSWGGALVAQYVAAKGTNGIESLILASPLLSTADWIADANELRKQLPPAVQETLRRHEAAGTTDSVEYREAEQEFTRRFVSISRNPRRNPNCSGSVSNPLIYQQMWGPSEFHATGSLKTFDVTPHLPKLNIPVLLIVGEHDEARPETAARYQKMIPGAKLHVVPNSAHSLLRDNPENTVGALREFLNSIQPRKR